MSNSMTPASQSFLLIQRGRPYSLLGARELEAKDVTLFPNTMLPIAEKPIVVQPRVSREKDGEEQQVSRTYRLEPPYKGFAYVTEHGRKIPYLLEEARDREIVQNIGLTKKGQVLRFLPGAEPGGSGKPYFGGDV